MKLEDNLQKIGKSWQETKVAILDACRVTCGETSDNREKEREIWWWFDEVPEAIKSTREACKVWQGSRTPEDNSIQGVKKKLGTFKSL